MVRENEHRQCVNIVVRSNTCRSSWAGFKPPLGGCYKKVAGLEGRVGVKNGYSKRQHQIKMFTDF